MKLLALWVASEYTKSGAPAGKHFCGQENNLRHVMRDSASGGGGGSIKEVEFAADISPAATSRRGREEEE